MDRLSVDIPEELASLLDEAVARGDYASKDAAVVDALEAWSTRHLYEPAVVEKLRALVAEGLASGPGEPWDRETSMEGVKARGRERLKQRELGGKTPL